MYVAFGIVAGTSERWLIMVAVKTGRAPAPVIATVDRWLHQSDLGMAVMFYTNAAATGANAAGALADRDQHG